MSLPLGVPRRAFSYDDALEDTAPMTPPPADLCASVLWKQPVIPERKYQELSKVWARGCSGPGMSLGTPQLWHPSPDIPLLPSIPPVLAPLLPGWRCPPALAAGPSGRAEDRARHCCLALLCAQGDVSGTRVC